DPALTYQVTSGTLVKGDAFTGDLSRTPGETPGTYAINQGTLALNSNYALTYAGADLTILTPLSVTLNPSTAIVGQAYHAAIGVAGLAPFSFAVAAGSLPPGLTLDAATGEISGTPTAAGSFPVTVRVADQAGRTGGLDVTLTMNQPIRAATQFAITSGLTATVHAADGSAVGQPATPFAAAAAPAGTRTVMADVTGDGVPDLITGTAGGTQARVVVLDGVDRHPVLSVEVFTGFTGGLFLAAGDVNGDGRADIAVSADAGGSGRVTVLSGADGSVLANFFGIDDPAFRGGARVALGDLNGDGLADLAVAAGALGGPRVVVYDGASLRPGAAPAKLVSDFFVFDQSLRNGAYVALGDLNGDGRADLIASGGPGGGPRILALDGKALMASSQPAAWVQLASFFAGDVDDRSGAPVVVKDLDGDDLADIIVSAPQGTTGTGVSVLGYLGKDIPTSGQPAAVHDYGTFSDPLGIFVG
ncbi:MAG TPA: FG-GAP-like repeat-containing protein, partial [Urbifossiella sp.]|nr:FG-GAP-like repeat-containing protein [Urbifossiella sp.]